MKKTTPRHYLRRIAEDGLSIRFWVSNFLMLLNISLPIGIFFDRETNSKVWFSKNSAAHKVFRNTYDPSVNKAVFRHFISSGSVVFDVGANIGMYTIFSARLAGPKGRVYAFEPTKDSFKNLLSNIILNKVDNVTPIFSAVSDKNTLVEFVDHFQSKEQNHLATSAELGSKKTLKTLATRLDAFIDTYEIQQIDFLKIDVEGAELSVLKSLGDKISSVAIIFFESSSRMYQQYGYTIEDMVNFLNQNGFKVFYPTLQNKDLQLADFPSEKLARSGDLVAVNSSYGAQDILQDIVDGS